MNRLACLSLFALLVFSFPCLNTQATPTEQYTVEGDVVYIDDDNCRIAVYPHTVSGGGYVYMNLTSKKYSGSVDFLFGFDTDIVRPKSLDLHKWENVTYDKDLSEYWSNESYDINYNYSYYEAPIAYDGYIWIYLKYATYPNGTVDWRLIYEHSFDWANFQTKIIYWEVLEESWKKIQDKIDYNVINYEFKGMDRWYYGSRSIIVGINYHLRFYIYFSPTLGRKSGKYWCAFKPHGESLGEAIQNNHFYALDPWWLSGWDYRKSHVINSASGAGTNYQIKMILHRLTGTDYNDNSAVPPEGHIYLNGHATDFPNDVTFTDDDTVTTLDYCIETQTSTTADFWVEVRDDLSSSSATIYVYYGKEGESSSSDGDDTFLFFDDFEDGGTPDPSKWVISGTVTEEDGVLKVGDNVNDYDYAISTVDKTFGPEVRFKSEGKFTKTTQGYIGYGFHDNWNPRPAFRVEYSTQPTIYAYYDGTTTSTGVAAPYTGTWEILWKTGQSKFYIDDDLKATIAGSLTDRRVQFSSYDAGYISQVEWVFVSKYVDPEPIHGDTGEEEYLSTPSHSEIGHNSSIANSTCYFYCMLTDDFGLVGFFLSTNNTGTWINETWTSLSGTSDTANKSLTLNSTSGMVVGFRFYVNDTDSMWLVTAIKSFTIEEEGVAVTYTSAVLIVAMMIGVPCLVLLFMWGFEKWR